MTDFQKLEIKTILVTALLPPDILDELEKIGNVIYEPWIESGKVCIRGANEIAQHIYQAGADMLICEYDLCSGPVFQTGLKIVAVCRSNPTNIDVDAATQAGVAVLFTPGCKANAKAEHTLGLIFALNQRLLKFDKRVKSSAPDKGRTPALDYRYYELQGKVFGVIGLGSTGYSVKWRAEALGMEAIAYDPYNPDATATFEDILVNSHIISMHAPVLNETRGIMGEQEFSSCRPGAIYINTANHLLQDTDALTTALKSGQLGGAGLDYPEVEKLRTGHPLLKMDNVILTPNIGGQTYDTEARRGKLILEDIERLFYGLTPVNIANPEVLTMFST